MPTLDETPWTSGLLGRHLGGKMGTNVDRYISSLETQGRERWTLYQYKRELQRFVETYPDKAAEDVTPIDVEDWFHQRCRELKSPASKRRALVPIRGLFTYLYERELVPKNPCRAIALPSVPESEPSYWPEEDVRRLLQAPVSPRDHLFLQTLARCGQRLEPTRLLTWSRIHLEGSNPYIAFPKAKGGKFHQLPMDQTLYKAFKAYKELTNPAADDYVFASRQRRRGKAGDETRYPISHVQARRIIHAACDLAGVRKAGAHEFRRSLATKLLADGVPFTVVSKGVLNHKNPQTTTRHYAGRDFDGVAHALRNVY